MTDNHHKQTIKLSQSFFLFFILKSKQFIKSAKIWGKPNPHMVHGAQLNPTLISVLYEKAEITKLHA